MNTRTTLFFAALFAAFTAMSSLALAQQAEDRDNDGVPDAADDCPDTPPGSKVLPDGCLPRNDCRKARAGEAAEENGCAIEHTYVLKGVKFEFDSDRLTEPAKLILKDVADVMKKYPQIRFELQGHTCNMGGPVYNKNLSDRRARSARKFLVQEGIPEGRITAVGYGLTQPVDTNETKAGRENNRRVELKVLE